MRHYEAPFMALSRWYPSFVFTSVAVTKGRWALWPRVGSIWSITAEKPWRLKQLGMWWQTLV